MQALYSGEILNLTPFGKGFVFAVKEQNDDGRAVARYYGYDAVNKALSRIKKRTYLKIKFGYEFEIISEHLPDYISCDSAFLSDGKLMTIFPNGNFRIFNVNGSENMASLLSYRDCPACDAAVDGDYVWSAVPGDNSVIKFSPGDGRIILRVGGGENTKFNRPGSVFVLGNTLYVCNAGSRKVLSVNTSTNEVRDYRIFAEKIIKYVNVQSTEFVWIDGGIFILD